jgi:hypothetical protein
MFKIYFGGSVYLFSVKAGELGGVEAAFTREKDQAKKFSKSLAIIRLHRLRTSGYPCWIVPA